MTVGLLLGYMALGALIALTIICVIALPGIILGTLPWRFG